MRKAIKGFIIGVIITILSTSSVLADGAYQMGWDDSSRTISLNGMKEKNIPSSELSNTIIKNYLDKVLLENDGVELLYGEFLDLNKFIYLSRSNDRLDINIVFKEKDEIKLVSKEISYGLEIGVVKLKDSSTKGFYTLNYTDGYMSVICYTLEDNKIIENHFTKAHSSISEDDEIYRFTSPESFGGTSHSFLGLDSYEYLVNSTLLNLIGVDRARPIKYGYDLSIISDNTVAVGRSSMKNFVNKYGEPRNKNIEFDDYLGGNTYTLIYEFGEAFFIPSNTDSNEFILTGLKIASNKLNGPRDISIGDSVESVLEKFHNKRVESVYLEENKKVVYSSDDESDIEYVVYDDSGNVIELDFVSGIETGGAFRFTIEFKNNRVNKIEVFQGYL